MLEVIIDKSLRPRNKGRGLELHRRSTPFGAISNTPPFPKSLVIPRSEWQARIKEKEETKSQLSDIITIPCKDQQRTNFCWANAPVHCVEILRELQNQAYIELSPASIACPVTNFRNIGGYAENALLRIINNGIIPSKYWPSNAISSQYNTLENQKIGSKIRCTEWWELTPRNADEFISCLLLGLPVAAGYNFWEHEVTAYDAIWLDNTIAVRIRNNWSMAWGDRGYGIIQSDKCVPDDAVVPRVVTGA